MLNLIGNKTHQPIHWSMFDWQHFLEYTENLQMIHIYILKSNKHMILRFVHFYSTKSISNSHRQVQSSFASYWNMHIFTSHMLECLIFHFNIIFIVQKEQKKKETNPTAVVFTLLYIKLLLFKNKTNTLTHIHTHIKIYEFHY